MSTVENPNPNPTPKKARRGVSNETRATAQLKFHERDAIPAGKAINLFVGHLDEVTVDWRTISDDSKGLQSFAGQAIPRLNFHFASNQKNASERRHVYQTILPVESNIDTIPGGKSEWQVNNVFAWIKHILDVYYLKGRELSEAEADALTLSFEDFDEEGNYVPLDAEDVIRGYQILFENAAAMLNGTWYPDGAEATGKKCYISDKGTYLPAYLKLLRYKKVKNEWRAITNGDLAFDTFIGEGAVELVHGTDEPKILHVDLSKESITPKETKKAPTVGVPGVPAMGGITPEMVAMGAANGAFAEAGGDMPF